MSGKKEEILFLLHRTRSKFTQTSFVGRDGAFLCRNSRIHFWRNIVWCFDVALGDSQQKNERRVRRWALFWEKCFWLCLFLALKAFFLLSLSLSFIWGNCRKGRKRKINTRVWVGLGKDEIEGEWEKGRVQGESPRLGSCEQRRNP